MAHACSKRGVAMAVRHKMESKLNELADELTALCDVAQRLKTQVMGYKAIITRSVSRINERDLHTYGDLIHKDINHLLAAEKQRRTQIKASWAKLDEIERLKEAYIIETESTTGDETERLQHKHQEPTLEAAHASGWLVLFNSRSKALQELIIQVALVVLVALARCTLTRDTTSSMIILCTRTHPWTRLCNTSTSHRLLFRRKRQYSGHIQAAVWHFWHLASRGAAPGPRRVCVVKTCQCCAVL